jgi:catechol 2,3-dioxygenase-like lactoylglutathione lyase family enzyme
MFPAILQTSRDWDKEGLQSMEKMERPIKAFGEIVLRVKNLPTMQEFYENVIGLELLQRFEEEAVFFKVAPGYAGHTQVLGLFAESTPPDHHSLRFTGLDPERTTIHHFAFAIGLADFALEKERLEKLGLVVETQEFEWVHWRSLYVPDPEGNLVELVCYDASVQ